MPEPQSLTATAENGEQIKSTQENRGMENMNLTDLTVTTTTTPRSVIIVPRSKSQAASGRVTPAPVADTSSAGCLLEKRLPNGDLYIGTFCGSTPHGSGKYLWRDGCMYEGEWKKGKASGRGRFSWPSGATFEGDFRSGRMEGSGTFIGPDGDMYKGSWSGDRKHGYGVKHCSNGDYYEGNWKKNLQDGHGRYLWSNGNEYIGEWKNGSIHGRGILIWKNGNRYDGNWDSGLPKGHGVFTWTDGSCYVGCWTTGNKVLQILNGTFYPSHNPKNENVNQSLKGYFNHKIWTPLTVMGEEHTTTAMISGDKNSPLADDAITERPFPRICIWESDGEAGDITCDIIDNSEASMMYRDGFALNRDGLKHFMRNPCCFNGGEIKKPGHMVSKGHKNYSLMLNLQLGIRYTVGKHSSVSRDLKETDFNAMEKFWTRFPAEGSKITPPHKSPEFRWKDYCPVVFRHLRELFQVDPTDYIEAICGNDALRELSSPGKSGSFFYLTQDDRFMIKTVKKSEVKVLVKMLPSYYRHVCRYENSLVTKFFGVHCVKPVCGVKTRFIVMGNLFCSEYRIHRRFDLKGSSHGRMTDTSKGDIDETTTLKDLDLNYTFRLHTSWYQELIKQIHRDCEFLESEHIMDYSFLVGLHFRDEHEGDAIGLSPFTPRLGDSYQNEAELQDMDRVLSGGKPLIRLGANMPARAQHVDRRSDFDPHTRSCFSPSTPSPSGEIYDTVLYFGIIDILQGYDITKKLEHAYKSLHFDSTSISAVDPKLYSRRFRNFVGRIFVEDE